MDTDLPARTVRNTPDCNRFEVLVGDEVAGFTEYLDMDRQRIFFHTEIDERFAQQGLAGVLVHAALTETRAEKKRIVPVCPYVAVYLERHDEFTDVTDRVSRKRCGLSRSLAHRADSNRSISH
jgi:predicted GNAT family acetyltransferase